MFFDGFALDVLAHNGPSQDDGGKLSRAQELLLQVESDERQDERLNAIIFTTPQLRHIIVGVYTVARLLYWPLEYAMEHDLFFNAWSYVALVGIWLAVWLLDKFIIVLRAWFKEIKQWLYDKLSMDNIFYLRGLFPSEPYHSDHNRTFARYGSLARLNDTPLLGVPVVHQAQSRPPNRFTVVVVRGTRKRSPVDRRRRVVAISLGASG